MPLSVQQAIINSSRISAVNQLHARLRYADVYRVCVAHGLATRLTGIEPLRVAYTNGARNS